MQGGFSIREYASKMRSSNVVKCWPFDETIDEETVKSLLPPITVKKFTWWLDELEYTHPQKSAKKKKKGEISPKAKIKAPKKRSIVEIFAVAPPVERVTSEDDDEEEEEESSLSFKRGRKKMKMKKTLRVVVNKMKKPQRHENKIVPNKESCNKLKLQVQDKATGKSSSSHNKDLDHNKKPVPCEAFKLIEENRCPVFPARGILKNNGDIFPVQQSMKCILHEAIQVNRCSTKMANKHVTFSEKDETIVCDDASIRLEKEVGGGPARNEHLMTCTVDPTAFTKRNNEEGHSRIPERSLLHYGNQDWCGGDLRDEPNDPMDVCSRYFRMRPDGYYNNPNFNMIRNSSNSTYRRPRPVSPPLHFEEYLRTYNEPPVAHPFDMEKRNHSFSENAHSFQFQSLPHFSPKDFVGLPLNSQGELIRSNSSVKRDDVNQIMNPSAHSISLSLPRNTVSSCYGHHSDQLGMNQLNLFPVESYVKENPATVIPSRLGIIETQSERITNRDMDFLEVNHRSFHDSDNITWRGDEQLHRSPENQPTMRLMGKEFTVGWSSTQGSEDGHIWKDKQIIDQSEPSSGKFRETLFFPSDSKYALPQFDRASPMYPSVFVARKTDPLQKMYPSLAPATFYNDETLSEPFTSGYESRLFTLDQEACPYVIPTSMQLKNNQNLHQAPISAIRFPFLHPDLDERALSPWGRRSGKHRFDAKEKELLLSSSQSCSIGHNHPYLKPGTSHGIGTDSSAPIERDDIRIFFPISASQTSVAPSTLPYYPGMLRHANQKKFKERTKKGSKSQLSALSTVPFKPFKMPILGPHEYTQCAIRKPTVRASFDDSVDCIEGPFGSYPAMNKSRFVMCGEYEADKDEQTISRWMDSHVDTSRMDPVKLSGGAKHILKAYKQNDQSSSTSIDQEISLSASNMDFRFPESENSAKFYRKTTVFDL